MGLPMTSMKSEVAPPDAVFFPSKTSTLYSRFPAFNRGALRTTTIYCGSPPLRIERAAFGGSAAKLSFPLSHWSTNTSVGT